MKDITEMTSPFTTYPHVAVVGAAGKMGSGISLLILQEMAKQQIENIGAKKDDTPALELVLIDHTHERLKGLKSYLHTQLLRWAEKNIIFLRHAVEKIQTLVSNKEIIDFFLSKAMELVQLATALEEAKNAELIFEAITENIDDKVKILKTLNDNSNVTPYFFSNTSSIPISVLNEAVNLNGKIIGFHFYNPPAVQKLIEIIPLKGGDSELTPLATTLAKVLDKKIIVSEDIAGFIGNGYFLREIMFALTQVEILSFNYSTLESIYIVNKVTHDFLLRPMGIFQLIDYVGLDVVNNIGSTMQHYLEDDIYDDTLLDSFIAAGKLGGQNPDGSQKNGFFEYEGSKIIGIFSLEEQKYIPLNEAAWQKNCDSWIGNPPRGLTWKTLSKKRDLKADIEGYFEELENDHTNGAAMAIDFIDNLEHIVRRLEEEGVAKNTDDVGTVLKDGFYHLYNVCHLKRAKSH